MLINMRLNGRSSLFTDKDSLHVVSIYYHIEYGQFIDLSGSEWLAPLAVAATTVVVTTLSVVLPTVGALAVSPQVTTALDGVVLSRDTLGTQTHATLQSSSGTLAAANHVELLLESGRESQFSAKWGVSSPIDSGETPTSADAKADIYQY